MQLTIICKSPIGFETHIIAHLDDRLSSFDDLTDTLRDLEQTLARRGYTPTHPRQPDRPAASDDPDRIRRAYRAYIQP